MNVDSIACQIHWWKSVVKNVLYWNFWHFIADFAISRRVWDIYNIQVISSRHRVSEQITTDISFMIFPIYADIIDNLQCCSMFFPAKVSFQFLESICSCKTWWPCLWRLQSAVLSERPNAVKSYLLIHSSFVGLRYLTFTHHARLKTVCTQGAACSQLFNVVQQTNTLKRWSASLIIQWRRRVAWSVLTVISTDVISSKHQILKLSITIDLCLRCYCH